MSLFLLPNLLAEETEHPRFLPARVDAVVAQLDGLIAESAKAGRRYLGRFKLKKSIRETPIALLNEHTRPEEIESLLQPLLRGEEWGLVSDAGVCCVADPGALLVRRAREAGVSIEALVGPSSILLALMLSGMSGQRFAFLGYLPRESVDRRRELLALQQRARQVGETQIFIETPYRNEALLADCLEVLAPETRLCVACDLTSATEEVISLPISVWRQRAKPTLKDRPAVFMVSAS